MTIQTGVGTRVAIKKQVGLGSPASGASAQIVNRVTSNLSLKKNTYQSNTLRSDYQVSDFRHGTRRVEGAFETELQSGAGQAYFESALRKLAGAAVTSGAIATIAAAGNTYTFSVGNPITMGFRVGMVVRGSGWTAGGVANNSVNQRVTAVTATTVVVAESLATKAEGDTVTIIAPGKVIIVPSTGHTKDYYTVEHWNAAISVSEAFEDCVVSTMAINCPASGMATANVGWMGRDAVFAGAEVFTSPTAASNGAIFAAVNGSLRVDGVDRVVVTGINFDVNGNYSQGEVIGSNTSPDIFEGSVLVSGQFSYYYDGLDLLTAFDLESELELQLVMTADNESDSHFFNVFLPRIKLGTSDGDDGQKAKTRTCSFQALLKSTTTGYDSTTIMVQDSAFA